MELPRDRVPDTSPDQVQGKMTTTMGEKVGRKSHHLLDKLRDKAAAQARLQISCFDPRCPQEMATQTYGNLMARCSEKA